MANLYSNVPLNVASTNQEPTVQAFNNYYAQPLELNDNVLSAMKGFFTSRGFEDTSAESITVAEILNYNRFKTSFLGYARQFSPTDEVARNIIP